MHSFILLVNNGKTERKFTDFFRDTLSLSVQNVSRKLLQGGGLYGNMDVTSLSLSVQTIVKGTKSYSPTFASNY